MTLGQSQWVGTDDDRVLSNADARIAQGGMWATNSADTHDVRLGLVWAGGANLLSGTSGLTVNVAPHHFLASKGANNGPYLGSSRPGGTTPVTVPAAPSLGSKRIDVIWVRQKDKSALSLPDASTAAEYGVATGVPGSSPSKVARGDTAHGFPADATEVGTVTWDSTTTVAAGTNASQCTLATTGLWTVARGEAIPVRSKAERDSTLTPYVGMRCTRLDAGGRMETYDGTGWWTRISGFGTTASTNAGGDLNFDTGLSQLKVFIPYNGNNNSASPGKQNITFGRIETSYVGGRATTRVFAANTGAAVANAVTVTMDWMAEGYS